MFFSVWIGLFDIVFAAYCCGNFVPASFLFNVTCHLLSDRGFKCWLLNVVNVVQSYFLDIIYLKALKTLRNQHCDGLKTPQVNSSCAQLLVGNGFERYAVFRAT